jgi:hypothetical protein
MWGVRLRRWGTLVLVLLPCAMLVAGSVTSPAATASGALSNEKAVPTCLGMAATIVGTSAGETINGTAGDDVIMGLGGNDIINAGGGNDRLCGNEGNDIINAGPGNDQVQGGLGNDTIVGGLGNDLLRGGPGADNIKGSDGNDTLFGEAGNDTLNGGLGTDTVNGGSGTDTCYGEAKQQCELPTGTTTTSTTTTTTLPSLDDDWFRVTVGGQTYICYDDPWGFGQQYECVHYYGGGPPLFIFSPDLYCSGSSLSLECDERWYPDELDDYTFIRWGYSDYICQRAYFGAYAGYDDYDCERYPGGQPPHISSSYPDLMCTKEWSSFDCNTEYYPSEMDGCYFARIDYSDYVCEGTWQGSECYRYYGGHPKAAMSGWPDYYCNSYGECSTYGYP